MGIPDVAPFSYPVNCDTRPTACPNCGGRDPGRFCPQCGQEQGPSIAPVPRMLSEIAEEILKWDAKIWVTLKGLCRPGFLTAEYLAGRRVRYIAPLRLYIVASFLYAVIVALAPHSTGSVAEEMPPANSSRAAPTPALSAVPKTEVSTPASSSPSSMTTGAATPAATPSPAARNEEDRYARQIEAEASASGTEDYGGLLARLKYLTPWLDANLSTVLVLILPLNALVLHLLYRKQQRLYAGQFLTVLHAQAAIFLLAAPIFILPALPILGWLPLRTLLILALEVAQPVYFYKCLRALYGHLPGETRKRTILKTMGYFALTKLPVQGLSTLLDVLNSWFH